MKVILITGKSGSGKSEVARILKGLYESNGQRVALTGFTKYLKFFASEVLGWDGNEDTKPRDFLQNLGVVVRGIHPDYLIKRMLEDLEIYKTLVDVVIISDGRMIDEVVALRSEAEAFVIRVKRDNYSKLTKEQKAHVTEVDLDNYDDYDYVIENNDNDLESKCKKVMEVLK